jgi:hypothetical protein
MKLLIALAAALALLAGAASAAQAAVARTATQHRYADPVGDNETPAPDIGVIVVDEIGGNLTFGIQVANLGPGLAEGEFLAVFIDTDRNKSTGCSGSEISLAVVGHNGSEDASLVRCSGGTWHRAGSIGFGASAGAGLYGSGAVAVRTSASLLNGSFSFWIGTSYDNDSIDSAGPYTFSPAAATPVVHTAPSTPTHKGSTTLTLSRHPNVRAEASGPSGANVHFDPVHAKGAASIFYSKRSGSLFHLGKTVVLVTARGHGKVAHTSFTVTVSDTTAPVFAPLASVTTTSTAGVGGANVTYGPVSAVDKVSGAVAATCTPQAGGAFPSGPTTISCSARDRAGNTSTASYPVVVPTISNLAALQTVTSYSWDYAPELVGATTTLTLPAANDLNGVALSYSWAASNGTLNASSGNTVLWTRELANGQPVPGVLTLTGSDGSSFTITF